MDEEMKQSVVTIVTVTYNAANWLERCVESVHKQKREGFEIEHLIIDGFSTDGTVEILQSLKRVGKISHFVSEKDSGVYDAMNKGLSLAQGEVIAFLNADDEYSQDDVVEKLAGPILTQDADYTFADACIVNSKGETIGFHYADMNSVYIAAPYCHQTLFCRTDLLRDEGGFDTTFLIVADADFAAKLVRSRRSYCYIPQVCVQFLEGGLSSNFYLDEIALLYLKYEQENIEYSQTEGNIAVQVENLSCYLKDLILLMLGVQGEQSAVKVASERFALYSQEITMNNVWPAYVHYFERLGAYFRLVSQSEKREKKYWEKLLLQIQTICPESVHFVRRLERLWAGNVSLETEEMQKLYYKTIRRIVRNIHCYWYEDRIRIIRCMKPLSPILLEKYFFNLLQNKNYPSLLQRWAIIGISYYYQWIKK